MAVQKSKAQQEPQRGIIKTTPALHGKCVTVRDLGRKSFVFYIAYWFVRGSSAPRGDE
jgi:hypothetical protein